MCAYIKLIFLSIVNSAIFKTIFAKKRKEILYNLVQIERKVTDTVLYTRYTVCRCRYRWIFQAAGLAGWPDLLPLFTTTIKCQALAGGQAFPLVGH